MLAVSPKVLQVAAAGLLLGGAVTAQTLSQKPVVLESSNPAQIRELALRVETQQSLAGAGPLTAPEGSFAETPRPVVPPPSRLEKPVAVARRPAPSPPQALTRPAPVREEKPVTAPAPPPPPVDPIRNVALMGVTHANGEDSAWLVDLSDQEREIVNVGDRAFGFTIKAIEPESVVLTRNGDDFELRLGQKQIASASNGGGATYAAASGEGGEGPGGAGGEGRRGRGGFPGFGGPGGEGFGGRFSRSGGGFSGFGGRGSRSGGDRGSRYSSSSSGSYGSSGSDSSRSSRYSSDSSRSGRYGGSSGGYSRSSSGGFGRGSSFGGSGLGGFAGNNGGGNNSQFSSSGAVSSTSNPQTARRRGARLSTGSDPIETPAPISNPQTTRRMGSAGSAGAAFGQDSGTVGSLRSTNGGRQGR